MHNLDQAENVAEVNFNPETKQVTKLTICQKLLRFKCRRCATFCCKLGGPTLTQRDVERITQAGYHVEYFLESLSNKESLVMRGSLKNREDGSCVFLKFDEKNDIHECSIYDVRPALCRLYPFNFEKIDPYSFVLKLIPCCRGLNVPNGKLVNEYFVTNHLLCAIIDLMTECNMPVNKTFM